MKKRINETKYAMKTEYQNMTVSTHRAYGALAMHLNIILERSICSNIGRFFWHL